MILTEEGLVGTWIVDPVQKTRLASVEHHYNKHKSELGANSLEQYILQAISFRQEAKKRNGPGKPVFGRTEGVRAWKKLGKFIHLAPDGEIASFGVNEDG